MESIAPAHKALEILTADGPVARLRARARRPATLRAYGAAIRAAVDWMDRAGVEPGAFGAPSMAAEWLAQSSEAGASGSTISQRLSALRWACDQLGLPDPATTEVREVAAGARRADRGIVRAPPLRAADIGAAWPWLGLRERSGLSLGVGAALRASELSGLVADDLQVANGWTTVRVRRSKTSDEVAYIAIESHRIASAVAAYLAQPDLWACALCPWGVVTRTWTRYVQHAARRAGCDYRRYSSHSMRAGAATELAAAGVPLAEMAAHTRHRSVDVAASYVRATTARTRAASMLGERLESAVGEGLGRQ